MVLVLFEIDVFWVLLRFFFVVVVVVFCFCFSLFERQIDTEIFRPLVQCPSGPSSWACARLKLGAVLLPAPPRAAGAYVLGLWSSWDLDHTRMGSQCLRQQLNTLCKNTIFTLGFIRPVLSSPSCPVHVPTPVESGKSQQGSSA